MLTDGGYSLQPWQRFKSVYKYEALAESKIGY
jgi:hypothetical protein